MSSIVRLVVQQPSSRQLARVLACQMSGVSGSSGDHAGAIREAGGAFEKREKALEDQYFRRLEKHQLEDLRTHFHEEIEHHEESIRRHQEAIDRHRQRVKALEDAKKHK